MSWHYDPIQHCLYATVKTIIGKQVTIYEDTLPKLQNKARSMYGRRTSKQAFRRGTTQS
jgi:hypothetical protein